MSVNPSKMIAIENNDEAYLLWGRRDIKHATVLHIDAHLDYRVDNTDVHIGNYLKQAISDDIVKTIYWIIPGSTKQFRKEIPGIKNKLVETGINAKITTTEGGIKTTIGQATLIVCPIGLLPQIVKTTYLIDIDLDFQFFSSCLNADRTENIGNRKPWLSTEAFAEIIQPYLNNSKITTLCYSTTGGWTPMRYRHFGDQLMKLCGCKNEKINQNTIAGSFFESFVEYVKKNKIEKAKQYYQTALALNPNYLSFYMTDGPLFLLRGDLKNAKKEFVQLRKVDPQNVYALSGLGLVEILSGNLKKAKLYFQEVNGITKNKDFTLFLIYIQSQLGEHEVVKKLLQEYRRNTFPQKPLSTKAFNGMINKISNNLEIETQNKNIGQMYLYPNKTAVSVWKELVQYSPNSIGNWSEEPENLRHTAASIESDLIEKMSDLYFKSPKQYGGYMTTGATEGNIFSAWIGRKYLERKQGDSRIVLVANDLTHYSVLKAADITGVTVQKTSVNTTTWNTDTDNLLKTVIDLSKKGSLKFLVPLTLGYTVGGTNDNIQKIIQGLEQLKKSHKLEYFAWIDAAFSGFTMPFIDREYHSFFPSEIQTVVVDFHKVLGVPMPAGFVLYKKGLSKYVKKSVPYLSVSDTTLLGSRNGVAPIAAWMSIHQLGSQKIGHTLQKELRQKNNVLKEIKETHPEVTVYTDTHSLHAAIVVKKELPESICRRFGLHLRRYTINGKEYLIYPVFFLPMWR